MSIWLEKVYLNRMAYRLPKFSWKKPNLANFRCPLCGDSEKNEYKCRGFIYEKKGALFMKCHNCQAGMSFYNFLKTIDPTLHKEYVYERFKDDGNKAGREGMLPDLDINPENLYTKLKNKIINLPTLESLPKEHFARAYIENRKIPSKWLKELYYASDYKKFIDELVPNHGKNLPEGDSRVVIPYYDQGGNLIAVQGRALKQDDSIPRYIIIKTEENTPKIWGMNKYVPTRQGYVLEGPFDAMFFDNSLAAGGASFGDTELFVDKSLTTFIYDNQPRNKELIYQIEKSISSGCKLFVWPDSLNTKKDINELILDDYTPAEIRFLVDSNTHSGLEAQVRLQAWKKC